MVLAVVLGGACRLRQYLARTSFWNDEAFIVLNLTDHPASRMLGPLDYNQAAPPVFLWIERAAFVMLGPGEYSLRLFPLLAGLGALALFARLAWDLFPGPVAFLATGWFAFPEKLISYSAEVKQYSSDALLAVVLTWIALRRTRSRDPVHRLTVLALIAAPGVWLSHPAAIVFGALSLGLAIPCLRQGWRGRIAWIVGNLLVVGSFAVLYRVSIVREQDPYLYSFWADGFPPMTHPARVPIWLLTQLYALCKLAYPPVVWVTTALATLGIIALCRRRMFLVLAACAGPTALSIAAAFAHKYPFSPSRLTLFLLPGFFLLCAAGAEMLVNARPWAITDRQRMRDLFVPRMLGWIASVGVLACGMALAGGRVISPHFRSHVRPAVDYVRAHRQPGDALYILGAPYRRHLEFFCYWRHPPGPVFTSLPDAGDLSRGRFWLIFTFAPGHPAPYIRSEVNEAAGVARLREKFFEKHGSAAYLFER